jgi:N6-adenosine-specific RNA methylase IME4
MAKKAKKAKATAAKKTPAKKPPVARSSTLLVKVTDVRLDKIVKRKDMGDITGLAKSIDERGALLQPIVIDRDMQLIAGQRRLTAWTLSRFRKEPIPAHVVSIDSILAGERDENAHRKDFTPSENVALMDRLMVEAKARAKERQREHGNTTVGRRSQTAAEQRAPTAADQVAAYVGRDRKTLAKAKAVVDAAKAEPKKFGELVKQMDESGNVNGPFRRLQIMQQTAAIKSAPPQLPGNGPYGGVVFDYPWPHEPEMSQDEIDERGRSLRPYPAMSIEEGVAFMDRARVLLAPDCVVGFWVTNYHMRHAFVLLEALGLKQHSTILTWRKDKIGRGQVLRDRSEHMIIALKGHPMVDLGKEDTVIDGPRRDNSQKPDEAYQLFQKVFPAPRYCEVFSRGGRGDLWDCHGDQADKFPGELGEADLETALLKIAEGKVVACNAALVAKLAPLARGARKKTLTKAGKAELARIHRTAECVVLQLLEAGQGVETMDKAALERLVDRNVLASKAKPKFSDRARDELKDMRTELAVRAFELTIPKGDDVALLALYRDTLIEYDLAVRKGDKAAIDAADEKLRTLNRQQYGDLNAKGEPASLDDGASAPIGQIPLWGQRGMFELEVDGALYIVAQSRWGGLSAYATAPEQPFPSPKTGREDIDGDGVTWEETPRACDVVTYATAQIRQSIGMEWRDGRQKKRKAPLEPAQKWFKLPAAWNEHDRPELAGEVGKAKVKAKAKRGKAAPAPLLQAAE